MTIPILRLRGADGQMHSVPAIRGEPGHTPVKGTDYWTAADKEAMVQEVLSALPVWEGGSY